MGLEAGDGEAALQAEWPGLVPAIAQMVRKGWSRKKWCLRGMNLEATDQRCQGEDRGPRDRKVSQDADAADQESGRCRAVSTLGHARHEAPDYTFF